MKKFSIIILVFSFVFVFFISGCSNRSQNISSPTPNIDKIKQNGKIVMLTNAQFPPFEYIGKGGKVVGVDVDVANDIANELGVKLEIVDMDFDFLVDSIKSNKGDFCSAGMTVTDERAEQVLFSNKYVKSSQYIIVREDSNITEIDLKNLTIAVQELTKGDLYVTDVIKADKVLRYKNSADAGIALLSHKCDAVVIDEFPAKSIVNSSSGALKLLPDELTRESYAIIVRKGKEDLLDFINSTLQRLNNEGKIQQYLDRHYALMAGQ